MNIFETLNHYAAQFQVTNSRPFNAVEKASVVSATVRASEYGLSVEFIMVGGTKTYIPVSRDSVCQVGDKVNLETSLLLTLERPGSNPINRVEIR